MTASGWETVVGLEVHCELRTETKLFCGCRNAFGDEPNTNICPVCLGLPGSLPVLNHRAVSYAIRIGTALHCRVQGSIFHRKNYFYPDMPKDYQISQYDIPINADGWLELPSGKRIGIIRAHIEEDTGKTAHIGGGGRIHEAGYSLVDYNRAGVPLVEIVSAPDMRSAEEARDYVEELRAILVATGVSDGKMEEGSLRVDCNVSVRHEGSSDFGTRCEVKNMNSLRSLARAISYEASRQVEVLSSGQAVAQETRHWDEADGRTYSMRSKEEAFDYRYFPEPDLVSLEPSPAWVEEERANLPVLPAQKRKAVAGATGAPLSSEAVATVVKLGLDDLVHAAVSEGADGALALRRLANEVAGEMAAAGGARGDGEGLRFGTAAFVGLVKLEQAGELTSAQARSVLRVLVSEGGDPVAIAERLGFQSLGPGALAAVVDGVIAANEREWERYAGGDDKLAGFFIGKVKAATRGNADLKAASDLLRERRSAQGRQGGPQ
ncbi:MAG TPA: Asp-tRNA(Asn)/Glu-tRNA(Gln) amidotransferase subunit GatB [Acidimicrobiales bacterium]|nr:Asp-tRNA(Asn)/Glu-tRNA(Gln) amidotransferase subunit GatB [Acidimicrobiales bacterium]